MRLTLLSAVLSTALLVLVLPAQARLGGDEASVYTDAQTLGTVVLRTPGSGFTRYTLQLSHGRVEEYAGAAGQVFAIRFGGGPMPPLDVLLGSYLQDYLDGTAAGGSDRRSARVQSGVLQASVHGRPFAINGLIWLPALLPAGIEPGALP